MATKSEDIRAGDVTIWEPNPTYTREVVTIAVDAVNENLKVGQVMELDGSSYVVYASASEAVILLEDVDVSSETQEAVVLARGPAVVSQDRLTYPAGTATTGKAALIANGIIPRDNPTYINA